MYTKEIAKKRTNLSEFKNDHVVYYGTDSCLICQGCGSIYIYTKDHIIDHCEVCPTCYGYKTTDGKNKFIRYGYAKGFGKVDKF